MTERPPRRDWIEIVQQSIEELSERISELDRNLKQLHQNLSSFSKVIGLDIILMDTIDKLYTFREGNLDDFDDIINMIKEKEEDLEKLKSADFAVYHIYSRSIIDKTVVLAKSWNIQFEGLASYFLENLGRELASKIVKKETIMKYYGKDVIPIWKSLLKE